MNPNEDKKNGEGNSPAPENKPVETPAEDAEFEKDLEALESGNKPAPAPKQERSELEKATFTAKSTIKRIKELGGNPAELLGEEVPPTVEQTPVDTSNFVTKTDLARQEAQKLAKSPSELKVIMWWIENKGMSVEDAHFMANKGKIKKIVGEVSRINNTIPANGSGGPGQRQADEKNDVPALSDSEVQRLTQSGMRYDPAKKAYVGKKIQHRYDPASKTWVTERI